MFINSANEVMSSLVSDCLLTGLLKNEEKNAQRDANTARALAVVRFGHRPLARCHKHTDRTDYNTLRSISTLGHVTQATPILASFCFPYAGGVRRPSLYQI